MDSLLKEVFPTVEAAKVACDKYSKEAGFALIIRNTKRDEVGGIKCRLLSCCKARAYRSYHDPNTHPSKRRSSNTQKTACPFKLWIKATGQATFVIQRSSNTHNHEFEDPSSFSTFRNETISRFEDQIISMHKSGSSPLQITIYIDQQIEKAKAASQAVTNIFPRDISNLITQYHQRQLNGLSPLEYLYRRIKKDGFIFRDRYNPYSRLTSLLIAPIAGLELLKLHPDVLLLDCTYKTNRFNMPLLNIYSITGTNKTFTVASVFLNNEALSALLDIIESYDIPIPRITVTDHELALINGIKGEPRLTGSVNLLYRWHININILAKCKRIFPAAKRVNGRIECDPSFQSQDEKTFNTRLTSFIRDHPKQPVDYALDTWLYPWKERFITYLVNLHRHLGHVTTSIVESLHGQIKHFLWSSKGNFDTLIDRFNDFWVHQIKNIQNLQSIQHHKISTFSIKPIYLPIRKQVTAQALKIIEIEHRAVELKPYRNSLFVSQGCICKKAVTWGLPCRHIIQSRLFNNHTLTLDNFNKRAVPFEPVTVKGKGRPCGSLNLDKTRSTRRDPSSHEIAVAAESLKARLPPPPSTAPANLETPRITGLQYIQQFGDTLEPGTEAPRRAQAARCYTPPDEPIAVTREAGPIVESQDTEGKSLTDLDRLILAHQDDIWAEEEEEDSTDDWDDIDQQQETQEEIICNLTDPKFRI
ncbi:unnamed protein product [Clonostachys chloroleuca]|uniref:MULE transposase domain-containing protein n=1 Tax=Clonostachys chloroleuca TaxID=1926264 RepID=A0AA35M0L5_9HYPO|nr:unnamed protein product [Clonostachys chloroleuca]